MVAVADRGGAHALQVAARARLGHGDGRDQLARAVAGQPPLALLGRGQALQVGPVDVVVHGEPGPGGPRLGQLLVEDQVVAVVLDPAAAVLLVDLDAQQPGTASGQPHVPRDHPVRLPLLVVGRDLLGDEGADHVPEVVVLAGEDVALHAVLSCRSFLARARRLRAPASGRLKVNVTPQARAVPSARQSGWATGSAPPAASPPRPALPPPRQPSDGASDTPIAIASNLHLP